MYMYKYFKEEEFKKAVPSCSVANMDRTFMLAMDHLREYCGFPLRVNSAYRSVEYEIAHNRSGMSLHTFGLALDIAVTDARKRAILVKNALEMGLSVGVYKNFVHIDGRTSDNVGKSIDWPICFYGGY